MIPSTRSRVPAHTAPAVNARIQRDIDQRVSALSGHPELIKARLRELDSEWDIERAIEMNASALAFIGTSLGGTLNKKWLILPAFVTAFLFNMLFRVGVRQCRYCVGLAFGQCTKLSRSAANCWLCKDVADRICAGRCRAPIRHTPDDEGLELKPRRCERRDSSRAYAGSLSSRQPL